jgi:hydroxypyruvate isomerase
MLRFAANLSMLFQEHSFLNRFNAASKEGFEFVEFLFPYGYHVNDLKSALDEHGLRQVLFNLPPGDWDAGERGIACLPSRKDEFRRGLELAMRYAVDLQVPQINCLAGLQPLDIPESLAMDTFLENLDFAANQLASINVKLVFEAINSRIDMPGFFIDTLDKSRHVLRALNNPNIGFQFDLYHMQIMHGDLIKNLQAMWHDVSHIQFADTHGRHEPGTGDIDFESVFTEIKHLGYEGFVSAEYRPKTDTVSSLEWLRTFN